VVKPQVIWPTVKYLIKKDGSKASTAIHGPLDLKYQPLNCGLENQFTPRDLCDGNNKWQAETRVQALHETVDGTSLKNVRPCEIQKLIRSPKLRKACGNDGIPNECLRNLQRRPLTYSTHLYNHCLRLLDFPKSWKVRRMLGMLYDALYIFMLPSVFKSSVTQKQIPAIIRAIRI
jgi:hypothetical protein